MVCKATLSARHIYVCAPVSVGSGAPRGLNDQPKVRVSTKTHSSSSRTMQSYLTQILPQLPPQPLPSGHDVINPLNRTRQKRPGSFADWPNSLHSHFPRPRAFVQQTKAAQASKEPQAVHDRSESCGRVMLQLRSKRHQASTSRPRAKTRPRCASNWQR